jgi:hypothetical protein
VKRGGVKKEIGRFADNHIKNNTFAAGTLQRI